MSDKTVYVKCGSSILYLEGIGHLYVLHLVDEDPRETLRRFVAGENVPVGGPFDNIEKAKEAGSAALTKAMALLNQKPGFRASRPGKA